jgi:ribosomal protein L13
VPLPPASPPHTQHVAGHRQRASAAQHCPLRLTDAAAHTTQTTLALTRAWHLVSARERVLGKLARSIALVLAGKHKPPGLHDQSQDAGDYVVVTHARHVVVTGNKEQQIVYRHHTMFPGGLKEIKYQTMMATKPEEVSGRAERRECTMAQEGRRHGGERVASRSSRWRGQLLAP